MPCTRAETSPFDFYENRGMGLSSIENFESGEEVYKSLIFTKLSLLKILLLCLANDERRHTMLQILNVHI